MKHKYKARRASKHPRTGFTTTRHSNHASHANIHAVLTPQQPERRLQTPPGCSMGGGWGCEQRDMEKRRWGEAVKEGGGESSL